MRNLEYKWCDPPAKFFCEKLKMTHLRKTLPTTGLGHIYIHQVTNYWMQLGAKYSSSAN